MALVAAIAVHHSALSTDDMHHGMDGGAVAEMCLGVFAAVGAAFAAVAFGIVAPRHRRPVFAFAPLPLPAVRGPAPRGRDGPDLLLLLCVCRC